MSASLWQSLIWSHASWDFGRCSSEASQGRMENGVGWDDMELTTNWQKEHLSLNKGICTQHIWGRRVLYSDIGIVVTGIITFIYVSLGGA